MKIILIIALALTLGADGIVSCTNNINRANVHLNMANMMYKWQDYNDSLRYMQEAYNLRDKAQNTCKTELEDLGMLNGLELNQMELKEMIKMLHKRLNNE